MKVEIADGKEQMARPESKATPAAVRVDALQVRLSQLPAVPCPVVHRFTPGLYIREIFMPKGTLIISKLHKTEHPFVISKGQAVVWTEEAGVVHLRAPHCGITRPGTRRVLFIQEDCVWTTFHPTQKTDLEEIEKDVIEPHDPQASLDAETLKQLGVKPKEET
ncbi:MAG TPA: hypothetical protein VHA37_04580 [Candidatus Saccharimonadales bacterium]|nr:hypothetical protein [Candidatus Saccharimonadales bacterium]